MSAHRSHEPGTPPSRVDAVLTWLGGGHRSELPRRHEHATHVVAGVLVLIVGAVAWLLGTLAIAAASDWPVFAIAPFTLLLALLAGAVARTLASDPARDRRGIATRLGVALAVGVVLGELASTVLFDGPIGTELDARAERAAATAPAVAQATAALDRLRTERSELDAAVDRARGYRDQALVVARCEYNPSPECPATRITGVPGQGPETRTANQQLAGAQTELDGALAARDRRASELDAQVTAQQQVADRATATAIAAADRGLGARWVAMNSATLAHAGMLLLRLLAIACCTLLVALPLILRLWRGETEHDRRIAAEDELDRVEHAAQAAIATKRAQVQVEAEALHAEQQLAATQLAVEVQTEIDREQQRRRFYAELGLPFPQAPATTTELPAPAAALPEPEDIDMDPNMHLPIAAAAEAASRRTALPPARRDEPVAVDRFEPEARHLPAVPEAEQPAPKPNPFLPPVVDDVARAAARWVRPLVPSVLARAIETTTHPLRSAKHAFEEVEEITFSLKRTRKVTVQSDEQPLTAPPIDYPRAGYPQAGYPGIEYGVPGPSPQLGATYPAYTEPGVSYRDSTRGEPRHARPAQPDPAYPALGTAPRYVDPGWELDESRARHELAERTGPREIGERRGPRELPPSGY